MTKPEHIDKSIKRVHMNVEELQELKRWLMQSMFLK